MKKILFGFFVCSILFACNNKPEEKTESATSSATPSETKKTSDEILPTSETDDVRSGLTAFTKGDIEGMTASFADTCRYVWSSLDSLKGKKAIQDYYKERWKLIDSLSYSDHVLVPIKVNVQQSPFQPTGKWVLAWSFAHVKYKTGKKLDLWVHNVYHFNADNKVDFVGQYMDRQPIAAATKP